MTCSNIFNTRIVILTLWPSLSNTITGTLTPVPLKKVERIGDCYMACSNISNTITVTHLAP
jgi:hypothetical protein